MSSGTTDREEAIGEKALLLRDLESGIIPGKQDQGPRITWEQFRERYQLEHLSELSEGSWSAWTTSANHLERLKKPKLLADVTKGVLSEFRGKLLAEGLAPNSVATYQRTIRAALGWAEDRELIAAAPKVRARKGLKTKKTMRSKPVIGENFDRILLAVPKVRPRDAADWVFFLKGLRESGLRVDELRRLSWDADEDLSIDPGNRYPMIRLMAEGQKSGEDAYLPITPQFWQLIDRPGVSRSGPVFPLKGRNGQMTRKRVIRVISEIGRKSGVITDSKSKKTATSHDIGRRAFLTAMSDQVDLAKTQQLARHSDPRTTATYYIRHEAEKLAEEIGWGEGVANLLQTEKPSCQRAP